jgi:hypothetical protein
LKNNIKIEDIRKLLKRLQDHLRNIECDDFTMVSVEELEMYVDHLSNSLQFYANRNYDNGLVARMTLGQMTDQDDKTYHLHANNTYDLRSDSRKI